MSGSLGDREMLWDHKPKDVCSQGFLSSPKLPQEKRKHREDIFLVENSMMEK